MKIGFVVNSIETELANYTTTRLAMAAVNRGHEAWLIGTGDLALDPDDHVRARARSAPQGEIQVFWPTTWTSSAARGPVRSGSRSTTWTC